MCDSLEWLRPNAGCRSCTKLNVHFLVHAKSMLKGISCAVIQKAGEKQKQCKTLLSRRVLGKHCCFLQSAKLASILRKGGAQAINCLTCWLAQWQGPGALGQHFQVLHGAPFCVKHNAVCQIWETCLFERAWSKTFSFSDAAVNQKNSMP